MQVTTTLRIQEDILDQQSAYSQSGVGQQLLDAHPLANSVLHFLLQFNNEIQLVFRNALAILSADSLQFFK
jgi:hypothetical protein